LDFNYLGFPHYLGLLKGGFSLKNWGINSRLPNYFQIKIIYYYGFPFYLFNLKNKNLP